MVRKVCSYCIQIKNMFTDHYSVCLVRNRHQHQSETPSTALKPLIRIQIC